MLTKLCIIETCHSFVTVVVTVSVPNIITMLHYTYGAMSYVYSATARLVIIMVLIATYEWMTYDLRWRSLLVPCDRLLASLTCDTRSLRGSKNKKSLFICGLLTSCNLIIYNKIVTKRGRTWSNKHRLNFITATNYLYKIVHRLVIIWCILVTTCSKWM